VGPEFSFKLHPIRPNTSAKKRKRGTTEPQNQENPWSPALRTLYTVEPGEHWESTSRYRKFTIGGETFQVEDTVLVNNEDPGSKPKPGLSPLSDILQDQWVAKVLEVRAGDEQHVYLRVYYMFRPEDLPEGRQWYHGSNELIASNEMAIIDAMTVNGRITPTQWDESDDTVELGPEDLFWRQTFDCYTNKLSVGHHECVSKIGLKLKSCRIYGYTACASSITTPTISF